MKLSSYNLIIYKSPYSYWYNTFTKISSVSLWNLEKK